MSNVVQVETEHLLLREQRDGDAVEWGRFLEDPDFRRYIPWRKGDETPEARAMRSMTSMLGRWDSDPVSGVGWVITRRADDQVMGTGGFDPGQEPTEGEIDYRIGKPFWGQGYGGEAAHAMTRFVLAHLPYERIVAYIVRANTGSIRIAESLGLRYEDEVDYLQFFPDPSVVVLEDPITWKYGAPRDEVTLRDGHYREIASP